MLSVTIYSGGDHEEGRILWDASNQFQTDPKDSELLGKILERPLWLMLGEETREVWADEDPVVFMFGLCKHYKSAQGISASECEDDEYVENNDELVEVGNEEDEEEILVAAADTDTAEEIENAYRQGDSDG